MVTTGGALVMHSIFKDIPIDPVRQFSRPSRKWAACKGSIVVPANSPHKTLADLVGAIKANPGGAALGPHRERRISARVWAELPRGQRA